MAGAVERLTTQDYVREALVVLGEEGPEALTIAGLCERLGVTKGSFYHHFGGLPGFVDVLLESWEREEGRRLAAAVRAYPDPGERLAALVELLVESPHATEAALRGWGRDRPDVAAAVQRVDRRRERQLAEAMIGYGVEREQARVLARLAVNAVVGAQHREQPVDVRRLWQLFEEFDRLL